MLEEYRLPDKYKKMITNIQLYRNFVTSQEEGFVQLMELIAQKIYIMQQEGKISDSLEYRARIKDAISALENHNQDKILDDIFGIEFISNSEQEVDKIRHMINANFKVVKKPKDFKKPNGYQAKHRVYTPIGELAKEKTIPVFECQYKTFETVENPFADHADYKGVNKEKVKEELKYNTKVFGLTLPYMWLYEEGTMRRLTYKETIQRIYPFVDVSEIREPENENNEEKGIIAHD